jgi:predicted CoA-binding protein
MAKIPDSIREFLSGRRIAVAGVSRSRDTAGNPVFQKLLRAGYEVFPVNPHTSHIEGVRCYHNLASVPGPLDGVVIATHPNSASAVVQQALEAGVPRVWFHRSFGQGSVSLDAVRRCREANVTCIVGGCPLMYCEPVDVPHRCLRAVLGWQRRLPS